MTYTEFKSRFDADLRKLIKKQASSRSIDKGILHPVLHSIGLRGVGYDLAYTAHIRRFDLRMWKTTKRYDY